MDVFCKNIPENVLVPALNFQNCCSYWFVILVKSVKWWATVQPGLDSSQELGDFTSCHAIQGSFGSHIVSYLSCTSGSFPRNKEIVLPLWHGLKHTDSCTSVFISVHNIFVYVSCDNENLEPNYVMHGKEVPESMAKE
jgi:hypothetical protein